MEDTLEKLIELYVQKGQSLVIEGVHILSKIYWDLIDKYSNTLCFLIYIEKEDRHLERFAIRSSEGTVDPKTNKYVQNFTSIWTI